MKKNKARGPVLPVIKAYYEAIVIKIKWYWSRIDKWTNGIEQGLETDPHIYSHLFDKSDAAVQQGWSFQQMNLGQKDVDICKSKNDNP